MPRRRAFDLVAHIAAREPLLAADERPLTEFERRAAETLMTIARAMIPRLDEIRDIARRAGLIGAGSTGVGEDAATDFLADPRLVDLVADRFPHVPSDPVTCRRYYDDNAEAFRRPDLYEGREILIGGDVTDHDWRGEAYQRAERIVAMLHYDRRVFKDLLVYSAAASRVRDGRIGPMAAGRWDSEVAAPFFSLTPGEVFPLPVPSSQGFHILMMDQVEPGRHRSFAEAEGDVARRLGQRARRAAAARHLAGLRSQRDAAE